MGRGRVPLPPFKSLLRCQSRVGLDLVNVGEEDLHGGHGGMAPEAPSVGTAIARRGLCGAGTCPAPPHTQTTPPPHIQLPFRASPISAFSLYLNNLADSLVHFTIHLGPFVCVRASMVAQMVKNLPAVQETWVRSLGRKYPLEKCMATHSSILTWRIPWTEEPGRLKSMRCQRVFKLKSMAPTEVYE